MIEIFFDLEKGNIKNANSKGFFESPLRRGVYFETNPDPRNGNYIFPQRSTSHVLKVFIPGLVRTDYAFIHRVVATIRPWREYCNSIRRLYEMEDDYLSQQEPVEGAKLSRVEQARLRRPKIHPVLEWWRENYDLIRDFATRRYAFNLVSYTKLLESPEEIIPPVIEWLGGGDVEAAVAAVDSKMRTQKDVFVDDIPDCVTEADQAVFDDFHDNFYRRSPLSGELIQKLNELDQKFRPIIQEQKIKGFEEMRRAFQAAGMSPVEAHKLAEKNDKTDFDPRPMEE